MAKHFKKQCLNCKFSKFNDGIISVIYQTQGCGLEEQNTKNDCVYFEQKVYTTY